MSSKKFVAPDRPEGASTMDIAQLKEMNISALTQVAKDLNIQGASGMRKQELIFTSGRREAGIRCHRNRLSARGSSGEANSSICRRSSDAAQIFQFMTDS